MMYPHLPRFTLGLVAATVALTTAATAAGPERLRLSKQQMDTVSAGTVGVTSEAAAGALGDPGYTSTHSATRTSVAPHGGYELGLARASANACCGPYTATGVATDSYADGLNQSRHQVSYEHTNKYASRAFGTEVVVSDNRTGSILHRPQSPRPR